MKTIETALPKETGFSIAGFLNIGILTASFRVSLKNVRTGKLRYIWVAMERARPSPKRHPVKLGAEPSGTGCDIGKFWRREDPSFL